jgi:hypothetical protein
MDLEFEIEGLRQQLTQKTVELIHLRKELVAAKRVGQPGHYELQGEERLGASLIISPLEQNGLDISTCTIQWHRESADRSKGGPITGEHHTVVVEVMQLRNKPNFDLSADFYQNVDNSTPNVVRYLMS